MTPDALAHLHARAFAGRRGWSAPEFAALLAQPYVFLVSRPQAFALGRAVAGEAELLTIATDPEHQRQGLGRACLADFENEARARDAGEAFLEVASDNLAAIALYQAAGYGIVSRRRGYYRADDGTRTDALILSRSLLS